MSGSAERALFFGTPTPHLFGWHHRAAGAVPRELGLVVCNPFGFEAISVHRSIRHLARAAAAAGFDTLRFDYSGCGDSLGDALDEDMLPPWLASVHDAIDTLKRASGARSVVLLGIRLGATLAALAAAERSDVIGVVAVAPVLRGRAYLRELRLLGGAVPAAAMPSVDAALESAGFVLSMPTCAALSACDLRVSPRAPAPRVLIVPRDDVPAGDDWAETLRGQGVHVSVERWPGYAGMVEDPQRTRMPGQMIEGIVGSLRHWHAQEWRGVAQAMQPAAGGEASSIRLYSDNGLELEESIEPIDAQGVTLFSVVTRPATQAPRAAVLLLNSGAIHHIGPNRLWVQLARRWAALGLTVMRLDISGLGDSGTREGATENVVYSPHAAADIQAALVHLRSRHAIADCHLLGLCSGAYNAFKSAVSGQAIRSALMINPLTYFWHDGDRLDVVKDYEVFDLSSKYRRKLLTRDTWLRLVRGQLDTSVIKGVVARRAASLLGSVARALRVPLDDDLARDLRQAARHGIALHFVFAANAPGYALMLQQSGHTIQRLVARRLASLDFVDGADHIFTRLEARERLVVLLDRLMMGHASTATPR